MYTVQRDEQFLYAPRWHCYYGVCLVVVLICPGLPGIRDLRWKGNTWCLRFSCIFSYSRIPDTTYFLHHPEQSKAYSWHRPLLKAHSRILRNYTSVSLLLSNCYFLIYRDEVVIFLFCSQTNKLSSYGFHYIYHLIWLSTEIK